MEFGFSGLGLVSLPGRLDSSSWAQEPVDEEMNEEDEDEEAQAVLRSSLGCIWDCVLFRVYTLQYRGHNPLKHMWYSPDNCRF